MKICRQCKKEVPLNDFYYNVGTKDKCGSWCKQCDTKEKAKLRIERKKRLVQYFGGGCLICGYKKCLGAIEFHHKHNQKEFEINKYHSFEKMLKEAKRCKMICANCHREIHAGLAE
mgnify:CR=1 FL=1